MNNSSNNKLFSFFKLRDTDKLLYLNNAKYAYAIYKDKRISLLDDSTFTDSINFLKNELKKNTISSLSKKPILFHLYYELGEIFNEIDLIENDNLLAIVVLYEDSKLIDNNFKSNKVIKLSNLESISKKMYDLQFREVQKNLNKGNCYQLNLTNQFIYKFDNRVNHMDFISKFFSNKESLSAYAHATYISSLDKLILSNSPECLFSIVGDEIITMPIKGTTKQNNQSWNSLLKSKKEQAELFMITDLMRNDLTKIAKTPSSVVFKKAKLVVPKIWHQYSQIKTKLPKDTNLLEIVSSIYPGGSITGAPKLKAINLLKEIEKTKRGAYCGSTILFNKSLKAGSINIRTADIDLIKMTLTYGSGGGITLLSETNSEYEEMFLKLESFLLLFDKE